MGDRVYSNTFGQDGVVIRLYADTATVRFPSGERTVPTRTLDGLVSDPFQRLAEGAVDDEPVWYDIRLRTARLLAAYGSDNLSGLVNSRVILRPHQIFVAHRVLQKPRPSMILADEVGLGKTVEAGLIVKELIARRTADRILIIVPPNLLNQWQTEMRIKFNELFPIVDGKLLDRTRQLHPGSNPWTHLPRTLMSSYLARRPEMRQELGEADWDLVIVDEAHHARRKLDGSTATATELYQTVQHLRDRCFGLLLLTATPMQLHPYEAYSLTELVEPGLYQGYGDFDREVFASQDIRKAVKALQAWDDTSAEDRRRTAALLQANQLPGRIDSALDREDAIDAMIGQLRITDAILRNRKRTVGGFTKRQARSFSESLGEPEAKAHQILEAYLRPGYRRARETKRPALGLELVAFQRLAASSSAAVISALRNRRRRLLGQSSDGADASDDGAVEPTTTPVLDDTAAECSRIDEVIQAFSLVTDAKLGRLIQLVKRLLERHPDEKILIFTQYYATQSLIFQSLAHIATVSIFNGKLNLEAKDRAVHEFRTRTNILVSTEAGGEGRNFQFCHILVNYDLHWNPMRIEQRIGRLDRYGQQHNVQIYNITAKGTVEDRLLELFTHRLKMFESTVGALELILGEVEEDFRQALLDAEGDVGVAASRFEQSFDQKLRDAERADDKAADFLIELGSFRKVAAERLTEDLAQGRQRVDLEIAVLELLGRFPQQPVTPEPGEIYSITVPPVIPRQLGRRLDLHYRGTFSSAVAVEDEDLDFFGFGHPMIDACFEYALSEGAQGRVAVQQLPELGEPAVALNYELTLTGVRSWSEIRSYVFTTDGGRRADLEARLVEAKPGKTSNYPSLGALEIVRESGERAVQLDAEERLTELAPINDRHAQESSRRAQRIHDYNHRRLDDKEFQLQERIHALDDEGRPDRMRIIPALRGQIEQIGRDRVALDDQLDHDLKRFRRHSHVDPSWHLVSLALLTPQNG